VPTTHVESVAPLAMEVLRREREQPLFLSFGFFETHREFLGPGSLRDVQYSKPPNNLPDVPPCAPTWPPSRRVRARSTTASASCSTSSTPGA